MIRKIIKIDKEKCNGCGACASACHEGAIDIIDGKAELVMILVERGADINAKNTFEDTPLKLAENKGYVTIIDYLKSKGALEK